MNTQRTTLETIAPTVEEAVAKGLAELGLPREAVAIEVLDEGSRGLFGLGTRQARVRLTIIETGAGPAEPEPAGPVQPATPLPAETAQPAPLPAVKPATQPATEGDDAGNGRTVVAELLERMGIRPKPAPSMATLMMTAATCQSW
jgi:spoIIIJ-associated protein